MLKRQSYIPIRWQLTGWFAGVLAAVLILFSFALYFTLQSNLLSQIDDSLKRRANEVQHRVDQITRETNLNAGEVANALEIDPLEEFSEPGLYVQVLDLQGRVLGDSSTLGKARLPIDTSMVVAAISRQVEASEAQVVGERVRIYYQELKVKGQTVGVIQVGESLKPYYDTVSRVRLFLILVGVLALAIATAGGWWLTRRALRPVRRVTDTARRIAVTRDFDERIPLPPHFRGQQDEIADLATTFNNMIEELGRVFDTNRQFMADTSHELRTPLTIIQGNLDLLKRGLPPEEAAEAIEETRDEASRLSRLVADLLMLAQADAGMMIEQQPVNLTQVAEKAFRRAENINQVREKNLTLQIERLDEAVVQGDEYRLGQAIFNLLENAVRYTPEGGQIKLALAVEPAKASKAGLARLSISDNGIGIAPEHLPNLFKRFYRVDKARSRALGGAGLGLAIVQYITEAHHGKVLVESTPGKGSTFTLQLPLLVTAPSRKLDPLPGDTTVHSVSH